MTFRSFTANDFDRMMRDSEGQPTSHRGERDGHAAAKHFLLSNAEMTERFAAMVEGETERRRKRREEARQRGRRWTAGGPIFTMVTAFVGAADMREMGAAALNSPQGQRGLTALFDGAWGEEGGRLEINFAAPRDVPTRYVQGGSAVRVMPVRQLTLVVDRMAARYCGLHVQTFFGGVTTGALQSNAVLYAADDEELLGFPGWAEP